MISTSSARMTKILHLVNITELNVFNGDIGIVLISSLVNILKVSRTVHITDGNEVIYHRLRMGKGLL